MIDYDYYKLPIGHSVIRVFNEILLETKWVFLQIFEEKKKVISLIDSTDSSQFTFSCFQREERNERDGESVYFWIDV